MTAIKRKHVNLLRSCALFLKSRANVKIIPIGWGGLMTAYAKDLEELATILEQQGVDETPVSLDEIFGKAP